MLVRLIVKKTPGVYAYASVRNQRTDFPVLACSQRQMFPVHTGFLVVPETAEAELVSGGEGFSQTESQKRVQNSLQNG